MTQAGLLFANVVEFDQAWGHRNDVEGFYGGSVPLLVMGPRVSPASLGTRATFADIGATVAEYFNLAPNVGDSFLGEVAPWKMI